MSGIARYTGKMRPGREMDALVAERVMGQEGQALYPEYSTEIRDAWRIVEKLGHFDKLREKPWWSVAICYAQTGQVGCRVYACSPGSNIFDIDDVIAEDVGSTAAEAICRVALALSFLPGER